MAVGKWTEGPIPALGQYEPMHRSKESKRKMVFTELLIFYVEKGTDEEVPQFS